MLLRIAVWRTIFRPKRASRFQFLSPARIIKNVLFLPKSPSEIKGSIFQR
jgi:hypothetical protein